MNRRTFVSVATLFALAGCVPVQQGPQRPYGYMPPPPVMARPGFAANPSPSGTRVALLAPLTGANAERGQALANAAKLALSDPGAPPLDVIDTGSTPAGAASAAGQAIAAGAGIILGPLTGPETAAAAPATTAAGVPMLPFTNDSTQAKPGVWPLGLTPTQQVRRLVGTLSAQGRSRFGAVLPQNEFGQAMAAALSSALADAGMAPADIRFHDGSMNSASSVMRDISGYAARRGPLDSQIRAARNLNTAEGRRQAAKLRSQSIPGAPIDVLLLADFGEPLATIASMLSYYDIDAPGVRIIGPAQWAAPAATGGAAIGAALYAAPDQALRTGFSDRYAAAFGGPAPGLADLAFDAAGIARVLAGGDGFGVNALCRPEGFAGVDGVLALQPDGRVRRGLAVFELQRGGSNMIEPAPDNLAAPGI